MLLLNLLSELLPQRHRGPNYYWMGADTGITWLNFDEGIVIGKKDKPTQGDTVISRRNNGSTVLYRVALVDDYKFESGSLGWVGTLEEIHIARDPDGYPTVQTEESTE